MENVFERDFSVLLFSWLINLPVRLMISGKENALHSKPGAASFNVDTERKGNQEMIGDFAKRVRESLTLMPAVIVSPRRAFRRVESSKSFVLVWILGASFMIVRSAGVYLRIGVDAIFRSTLQSFPGIKFSPAILDTFRKNTVTTLPFQMVVAPLIWILGLIVVASVLFEIDRGLFKNHRSYSQVLSIVTYAQMPGILFSFVVCILLWSYPDPSGFSIQALIGTSVGQLIPPESVQPFYKAILDSLDLWAIWSLLLVGIGLSSERTRISKALGYAGTLWFIYIVVKAGFFAMYVSYMSDIFSKMGMGK